MFYVIVAEKSIYFKVSYHWFLTIALLEYTRKKGRKETFKIEFVIVEGEPRGE